MIKAILSRSESSPNGTFGTLVTEGFSCFTVEREWLDNMRARSCIPADIYTAVWHRSPRFGWCYILQDVPNRNNILFHAGNYPMQSQGCILLNRSLGYVNGKKAGIISRPAVYAFHKFFNKQPFLLEVRNDYITDNAPIERSYGFAGRLDRGIFESTFRPRS